MPSTPETILAVIGLVSVLVASGAFGRARKFSRDLEHRIACSLFHCDDMNPYD